MNKSMSAMLAKTLGLLGMDSENMPGEVVHEPIYKELGKASTCTPATKGNSYSKKARQEKQEKHMSWHLERRLPPVGPCLYNDKNPSSKVDHWVLVNILHSDVDVVFRRPEFKKPFFETNVNLFKPCEQSFALEQTREYEIVSILKILKQDPFLATGAQNLYKAGFRNTRPLPATWYEQYMASDFESETDYLVHHNYARVA